MENYHPLNDYFSLYQGYVLLLKGDRRGALEQFSRAYSRNDEFFNAAYAMGTTYDELGDSLQAIKMYSTVIILTKGFYAVKLGEPSRQAINRIMLKYLPELDVMRKRVASNPSDLAARGELALKLDALYLHDEALNNYLEMERLGMKSWQLFFNVGNIYKKKENYRDAAAYYEKCLHMKPDYSDALNNLGTVYKKMHRYDLAIGAFERILASDRQFAYAPFNLAMLYMEKGDNVKSLRYFRDTYERFPGMRANIVPYLRDLQ
jgi:tetratricopeptide (TPR) repeat protein